jgi:hypothetical protein
MDYSITILLISVMLCIAVAIFFAPWAILKYYNKDKKKAYLTKIVSSGRLKFVGTKALCFCLITFSFNFFQIIPATYKSFYYNRWSIYLQVSDLDFLNGSKD